MAKRVRTVKRADIENPPSGKGAKPVTEQGKTRGRELYLLEITIYVFVVLLLSAGTYWRNKVWKSEVELWTDCVRKSPDKDRPHLRLGAILVRQGRYQEAMAQFTDALRINPDSAEAHANMGAVFIFQGRYQEAMSRYTEALRIKPGYAEAHYSLGVIFIFQRKYREAIDKFTEALRIKSDYAEAHYELGTAYLAMGDRDSALREYEILKSKNPRLADALSKGIK